MAMACYYRGVLPAAEKGCY